MVDQVTSRDIRAKDAVDIVRSGVSNAEIMKRFKISAQGFADLLKQLFEKKLITEQDLASRGIRFKVVKKETVPEVPVIKPLQPMEHDEEFLDTVELTELLAFKVTEDKPSQSPAQSPAAKPEEKPQREEPPEKKSRFSLSGLFKKDR
jgi:transposase